jgi:hypothetical protein
MKLNRHHIFLIGLFTGFAFVGIHILNYHLKSDFAKGNLVAWVSDGFGTNSPKIKFTVNDKSYEFLGESNLKLKGMVVIDVIYDKNDPKNAAVYTFMGFYMRYFFFLIIPIMLYAAFIYSWFDKRDFVIVDFKKKKISKSTDIMKIN